MRYFFTSGRVDKMTITAILNRDYPDVSRDVILSGYTGSISHGTHNPDPNSIDDVDAMYVVVPPIEHYFGLSLYGSRGTKVIKQDRYDIVVYEAQKFISLLAQGNPNVLCMLWLKPEHYIDETWAGSLIINNKHLFIGKHVYNSFIGYAHDQLKKMTRFKFEGYMGDRRKQLVDHFGFDCKNSSHLIRLLRMGIEFLQDGELHVFRSDAQELRDIKAGKWSLEQVRDEANMLFTEAKTALAKSTLPEKPDYEKINKLCVQVVCAAMGYSFATNGAR